MLLSLLAVTVHGLQARAANNDPHRKFCFLVNRFREHGREYIRFITTPDIEPTNNLAEQAIRFVVLDRKVTQGTRSEAGRQWCERIWTVIATCAQHGKMSRFLGLAVAVAASAGT